MTSLIRVTDVDTNQIKPFMPTDLSFRDTFFVSTFLSGNILTTFSVYQIRLRPLDVFHKAQRFEDIPRHHQSYR